MGNGGRVSKRQGSRLARWRLDQHGPSIDEEEDVAAERDAPLAALADQPRGQVAEFLGAERDDSLAAIAGRVRDEPAVDPAVAPLVEGEVADLLDGRGRDLVH